MSDSYLPTRAKVLLEDFESAFSETWNAAQDVLYYIEEYYDGDRSEFFNNALNDCDYYTIAQALKLVIDFSEN